MNTPGCFLEAKDILRRHFFAYCIDTWISSRSGKHASVKYQRLKLTEGGMSSEGFVINRIIAFIKANKGTR